MSVKRNNLNAVVLTGAYKRHCVNLVKLLIVSQCYECLKSMFRLFFEIALSVFQLGLMIYEVYTF